MKKRIMVKLLTGFISFAVLIFGIGIRYSSEVKAEALVGYDKPTFWYIDAASGTMYLEAWPDPVDLEVSNMYMYMCSNEDPDDLAVLCDIVYEINYEIYDFNMDYYEINKGFYRLQSGSYFGMFSYCEYGIYDGNYYYNFNNLENPTANVGWQAYDCELEETKHAINQVVMLSPLRPYSMNAWFRDFICLNGFYNEYGVNGPLGDFVASEDVVSTAELFMNCDSLGCIDLYNFYTDKNIDMNSMFRDCDILTDLDLTNFITYNVMNMEYMFADCHGLVSIIVGPDFNTDQVIYGDFAFLECDSFPNYDCLCSSIFDAFEYEYIFMQ